MNWEGVLIHGGTLQQQRKMSLTLSRVPTELFRKVVSKILIDSRMGPDEPFYPNHGRYSWKKKRIRINRNTFNTNTRYGSGPTIDKPTQILLHELSHGIDHLTNTSRSIRWRKLSGWEKHEKKDAVPAGKMRLVIHPKHKIKAKSVVSDWIYDEKTSEEKGFARWYARRSPKEDFAETASFVLAGIPIVDRPSPILRQKIGIIQRAIRAAQEPAA